MRTLYFECNMGAAGDMLMSALLEICPDPDGFIERLNNIGIPDVKVVRRNVLKCGIQGTGVDVLIGGVEEDEHMYELSHEHDHNRNRNHDHNNDHEHNRDHSHIHERDHEHGHGHEHGGHSHTGMDEIRGVINGLGISDKIKADVLAVYNLIAEAESRAHGRSVEQIHFHEVGAMDAVADITGVCMLIDELKPDRIVTSKIHVGFGRVRCAHGLLPVPAPATAYILRGVPTYGGAVEGELCTPTGAALLKYFTDEFADLGAMSVSKIGYGMGKRSFYTEGGVEILSAVRVMLGESEDKTDNVIMLSCNIDDMTGERAGFAVERILAGGALDAYTAPIYMKKGRPGILLTVICDERTKDDMVRLIFKHTTTLGIRELRVGRYVLSRSEEIVKTEYGDVRVKKSFGYGVTKLKAEDDDLKRLAVENDLAITDIEDKL
ncbi:MAG TPA: nickel pincer cofactor biosynthesis protein LarC [Firmicutes bacterium]|nr:nickel pincer cofactor biosynthesis protein LarC [Bacillota bacterium]